MEKKFQSRLARVERNGRTVILCRPQTFMNASGEAVGALVDILPGAAKRMLVAVDDADLPLGEIRLRARRQQRRPSRARIHRAASGHAGICALANRHRPDGGRTAGNNGHVLAPFTAVETAVMEEVLTAAAAQVECWLDDGIEKAMNQFNGAVGGPGKQRKLSETIRRIVHIEHGGEGRGHQGCH